MGFAVCVCRELTESVRVMSDEKSSLEKIIAGFKNKTAVLREDLLDAQRTIADLTVQLTSSFEAREEAVKTSVKYLFRGFILISFHFLNNHMCLFCSGSLRE